MPRTSQLSLLLLITVLLGCGSSTEPPSPSSVVISPSLQTAGALGASVQFTAQVRDESGNSLTGFTVTWSSTDQSVATIDDTGLATATGLGSTTIRATVQTVSGTAMLNVEIEPAEVQKVSGDGQTAPALSVLPDDPTVRVVDGSGDPIPGATVTFSVVSGGGALSPLTATTDGLGEASTAWTLGLVEGTQVIRATSGAQQTDFTVTATEPLLSVSTLSLPDARATLGYSQTLGAVGGDAPYSWSVVGGSPPSGISVAGSGAVSGTSSGAGSGTFTVRVTDATGDTASRALTLQVCEAPLSLSDGDVHVSNPVSGSACAPFIPAGSNGDQYRVGVVRTGLSGGSPGSSGFLASATVTVTEAGAAGAPSAQIRRPTFRAVQDAPPGLETDLERARATAAFHRKMLEDGERLIRELGRDAVAPATPSRLDLDPSAQMALAAADPPDRTMIQAYTPTNSCSSRAPVPGLLVAFNDHIAIYQDSTQRASDPIEVAHAQVVLDYYEAYGLSTINEYFGGVTDIDGDTRVTVFVSPAVTGSVAAFVWPGDFLLATECAASNQRELIYFGEFMFDDIATDGFQALPVLVHEMKHVSSLFNRLVSTFHPVWIEEGTAEIAAETSSRKAMEAVGDVDQGALLTRNAFPPMNIADQENFGVLLRLSRMTRAYSSPVNSLVEDPLESPDHTFYGSSWHFHRFLGDAYGNAASKADGVFFTELNDSLTAAGTTGITAVTGKATALLLEEYAAAVMLNGTGAPQPTRAYTTYEFPTATNIFIPEFQPPGEYPWPETGPAPLSFADGVYTGDLAPGGLRVHEFQSDGVGDGIEIRTTISTGSAAKVVIVRVN